MTTLEFGEHKLDLETPEERAMGMAESWRDFVAGYKPGFLKYFMVELEEHDRVRELFLKEIGANTDIPVHDYGTVHREGYMILRVTVGRYEDEAKTPYGTWYQGVAFEPIQ